MTPNHQQCDAPHQQAADQALETGGARINVLMRRRRNFVSFAAQDSAEAIAEGGEKAEDDSNGDRLAADIQMFARNQGERDAEENDEAGGHLPTGQAGAEPKPFHGGGENSRAALDDQQTEARTEPGQALEKKNICADADDAAEEKQVEGITADAFAKRVGPNCQHGGGAGEPPEVGFRSAQHLGRAIGANH